MHKYDLIGLFIAFIICVIIGIYLFKIYIPKLRKVINEEWDKDNNKIK